MAAAGNAEATKERILKAAMAEFSAYGIAGARVDRIANTAGCNKNLIYIYFENKETLFTTVLEKNILRVYEDLAFTPEDLPGYAMRVFDFAMAHPDLMRLMVWSSLEQKAGTVRRWEREGRIQARRGPTGQRYFDESDIGKVLQPGFDERSRKTVV